MGRGYFIMHSHRQASFLKRSVELMTIVTMVLIIMIMVIMTIMVMVMTIMIMVMTIMIMTMTIVMMVMTIVMMSMTIIMMMMMKGSSTAWLVPVAGLGWSKNSSAATPLMDRARANQKIPHDDDDDDCTKTTILSS